MAKVDKGILNILIWKHNAIPVEYLICQLKNRLIISVQLHVGGDNVAVGYFKNPKETEECFYEADGRR
jgi:hypothetical protein